MPESESAGILTSAAALAMASFTGVVPQRRKSSKELAEFDAKLISVRSAFAPELIFN